MWPRKVLYKDMSAQPSDKHRSAKHRSLLRQVFSSPESRRITPCVRPSNLDIHAKFHEYRAKSPVLSKTKKRRRVSTTQLSREIAARIQRLSCDVMPKMGLGQLLRNVGPAGGAHLEEGVAIIIKVCLNCAVLQAVPGASDGICRDPVFRRSRDRAIEVIRFADRASSRPCAVAEASTGAPPPKEGLKPPGRSFERQL